MTANIPNHVRQIPDAPDPLIDVASLDIPDGYVLIPRRDLFLLRFYAWADYPMEERIEAYWRAEELLGLWK